MKVAVLTGGGDVPGLNPAIKAIVNRSVDNGYEVIGIRRGWGGLVNFNPDADDNSDWVIPLNKEIVRRIDRTGGTFLHTSRTNPLKVKPKDIPSFLRKADVISDDPQDLTDHVINVIDKLGIDYLVPIGGDDTLGYGAHLADQGISVIGIPKTMDNDVHGTDYCIGFSTAVTRSVEFIHALRTSTGSHERIAVIELFGRNSGETSLIAAYLAGVDRALISEVPFDIQKLAKFIIEDKCNNPSHYAMLTVSEGAHLVDGQIVESGQADAFGHRKLGGIGLYVGDKLKELTGQNIIYQRLGYLMRSGAPDSLDLMVAANYAQMAMGLVERGHSGRLVCLQNGVYSDAPIGVVSQGIKRVDVDVLYDVEHYRPRVHHVVGMPMFLT